MGILREGISAYGVVILLLLPFCLMTWILKLIDMKCRRLANNDCRKAYNVLTAVYSVLGVCFVVGFPFLLRLHSIFVSEFWLILFGILLLFLLAGGLAERFLFGRREREVRATALSTTVWNVLFQAGFTVSLIASWMFLLVLHADAFQKKEAEAQCVLFSAIAVSVCLLLAFGVLKAKSNGRVFGFSLSVKNGTTFLLLNLIPLVVGPSLYHYEVPFAWLAYVSLGLCNVVALLLCVVRRRRENVPSASGN
ncbi:MAG: hypothetical protein IJD10_05960 [Clostridia bacterium]|nr:hypothetical protein [Clostridia bacterium]